MTDESRLYPRAGREFADHQSVNHSKEEWKRGEAHTNTIEGYFSVFKRGMKGVYQLAPRQHMQRYLDEFDLRYNHRMALGVSDTDRSKATRWKASVESALTYAVLTKPKSLKQKARRLYRKRSGCTQAIGTVISPTAPTAFQPSVINAPSRSTTKAHGPPLFR